VPKSLLFDNGRWNGKPFWVVKVTGSLHVANLQLQLFIMFGSLAEVESQACG
jgi:hypothetical protein